LPYILTWKVIWKSPAITHFFSVGWQTRKNRRGSLVLKKDGNVCNGSGPRVRSALPSCHRPLHWLVHCSSCLLIIILPFAPNDLHFTSALLATLQNYYRCLSDKRLLLQSLLTCLLEPRNISIVIWKFNTCI
jgi:hypothetical protein